MKLFASAPLADVVAHGLVSAEVLTLATDFLRDGARRTHQRLGDVAGVAVTTAVVGQPPVTVGASTALAAEVDRVQYAIGRGPCLHALAGGGPTYSPDLARDQRWGPYGAAAAARGARSCFAVPVVGADGGVVGVVKVYAGRVDGIDQAQRDLTRDFAREVAGGVALATVLAATATELDDRVSAMDTRRAIDLATGIVMARLGCTPEAAFDALRHESQLRNVKLHDVARDLVSRTDHPPLGDPAPTAQAEHAPFGRRGAPPLPAPRR